MTEALVGRLSRIAYREVTLNRLACRTVGVVTFVVLTSLGAYIRIPLPFTPVPVTLQTFFVLSSGALLGAGLGLISQLCYIAIGAIGVPVFSGGQAGSSWLVGATGGYIWSFWIASLVVGLFWRKESSELGRKLTGMLLASAAVYVLGSLHLAVVRDLGFKALMVQGVVPFLPLDLVKLAAATGVSYGLLTKVRRIFQV